MAYQSTSIIWIQYLMYYNGIIQVYVDNHLQAHVGTRCGMSITVATCVGALPQWMHVPTRLCSHKVAGSMAGCPTHKPFVLASTLTWPSLNIWWTGLLYDQCTYNIVWYLLCGCTCMQALGQYYSKEIMCREGELWESVALGLLIWHQGLRLRLLSELWGFKVTPP